MVFLDNDCVGCERCVNCGRRYDYRVLECNECGDQVDTLYKYENQELCEDCLKKQFEKITEEE